MPSKTINLSSSAHWTIYIDLISQNFGGNYSTVRVRGVASKSNGFRSFNNNGVAYAISGTRSSSRNAAFDVPGYGSQTCIDSTWNIAHSSTGYLTVTFTATLGNTGTSAFGGGGSVTLSYTLPRIPKVPSTIATPGLSFTAPKNVRVSWSAPNNNGRAIDQYQVQYDSVSNFSSPSTVSAGTATAKTITLQNIGQRVWFRVRAHNSMGWGSWSSSRSITIPDVPGQPLNVSLAYKPPFTMTVSWSVPSSNGGAGITAWDTQYWINGNYTATEKIVRRYGPSPQIISDLDVGYEWNFRVRAINSQGAGEWSITKTYLVVCGPRIWHEGAWHNTIAFLKHDGVWRNAIPYVKHDGTWKIGAG